MDGTGIPKLTDVSAGAPLDHSRGQLVYRSIKDLIRNGSFAPGQRLREVDLAVRLGVSRTPVREALNRLKADGLLALHPMRGFAVAELDRQQVLELYALREFIEGASARFAAQHASSPELRSLRAMLEEARRIDPQDARAHSNLNKRFHAAIGEASHNRYLKEALARLTDSLDLICTTAVQVEGRMEEVDLEHIAILDAIEARNADRAEKAMRVHVRKSGELRLVVLFGSE
jgi:DNA-binding GntR family transcriptional regulator